MPLITQGLRPDLKADGSQEAAIHLKRNQQFLNEGIRKNQPAFCSRHSLTARSSATLVNAKHLDPADPKAA